MKSMVCLSGAVLVAQLGCTIKTVSGPGGTAGSTATPDAGSTSDAGVPVTTDGSALDQSNPDGAAIACGTITELGACDGNSFVYCKDGLRKTVDCTTIGAVCSPAGGDGGAQAAGCQTLRAEPCGTLTPQGTCDGDRMLYCDVPPASDAGSAQLGVAKEVNCAAYGQTCNPSSASAADHGAACEPRGLCPTGVDENGVCDTTTNTLRYCEKNSQNVNYVYTFDCGVDSCRTTASGVSDCFMAGVADGCAGETALGRCEANGVLVSCLGNVVTREDCPTLGLACTGDATNGYACRPSADCAGSCPTGYTCQSGRCAAAPAPSRQWTFAVYIVGDNNLADAAWDNLNQMEAVGSNSAVQVVTQFELSPRYTTLAPPQYQTGVYRMPVVKDEDTSGLTSLATATQLSNVNMSKAESVAGFLRWTAQTYPAQHIAFIMWDHGMGYQGGFVSSSTHTDMSLKDVLDGVRTSGVHLDLMGFDACLMGQHEVAMAFRGVADVLAASEEVEPGAGYPYDAILQRLVANPAMLAPDLGTAIVEAYAQSFQSSLRPQSVTMSAVDLSKATAVNQHLASFVQSANAELAGSRSTVLNTLASPDVLRFHDRNSADMATALAGLATVGGGIGTSASDFQTWLASSGAVIANRTTGEMQPAKGLAFFLPEPGSTDDGTVQGYRSATSFLPLQPWHAFVANLAAPGTPSSTPTKGATSFSLLLTWGNSPSSAQSNADLDLYVYEPDGDFGTPSNGTVSGNGLLSADSAETGTPRESYELKADHQSGTYIVLVHVYAIPGGEQAYPRLQLFRDDLPGGSRTLLRGRFVNNDIQEVPMDNAAPLVQPIDSNNIADVMNHKYSNLWYATTIEVQ